MNGDMNAVLDVRPACPRGVYETRLDDATKHMDVAARRQSTEMR